MQNKKICNIDKIKLFSFDIFDTLITRKTIAPDGIFAIMQKIINSDENFISLDKDVKTNFFNYRKYSEHICSSKSGRYINEFQETTLNEIYSDLQKTFLIPSDMIEKLMALEIKVEYDNSVGIKENIDKVKFLIQNKKRVVLISDMYLDHKTIRNMLLKADEIFKDIPIYVSSETGCKKTTGLMYEYVKNKEKVEYKEWHHTGDNLWADAGSAVSYGINIDLYTK